MNNLTTDANLIPRVSLKEYEEKLDQNVLEQIEKDLNFSDKLSVLFLLFASVENSFQMTLQILSEQKTLASAVISVTNWKAQIIEALCLIQNKKVLKKVGLSMAQLKDVERKTYCRSSADKIESNLRLAPKCLYLLCESISSKKTRELIDSVYQEVPKNKSLEAYDNQLEIHILWWIEQKFVRLSGKNLC